MKHHPISVLANATLPFSGLRRSSGSGSIPLCEDGYIQNTFLFKIRMLVPDESVDFLDGVLDLVIRIRRLDTELEDESVDFIHDKGDFDVFLQSVPNNGLRVDHHLR